MADLSAVMSVEKCWACSDRAPGLALRTCAVNKWTCWTLQLLLPFGFSCYCKPYSLSQKPISGKATLHCRLCCREVAGRIFHCCSDALCCSEGHSSLSYEQHDSMNIPKSRGWEKQELLTFTRAAEHHLLFNLTFSTNTSSSKTRSGFLILISLQFHTVKTRTPQEKKESDAMVAVYSTRLT